jgi:D-lactate dehydrogenase
VKKVLMTSTKPFEREKFEKLAANQKGILEWTFLEAPLDSETAVLAQGFDAVCVFVTDKLDAKCLVKLYRSGVRFIALRSAGFNHVDLNAANE